MASAARTSPVPPRAPVRVPDDWGPPPALYSFSGLELLQLVLGTLTLAVAFSFPLSCSSILESPFGCGGAAGIAWDVLLWPALPISLAIVVVAFVCHELAHKLIAQRFGLWAEFRASYPGLALSLVISVTLGVVVASPGVVLIMGPATKRDAGIISVGGPLVNLAFALIALPLWVMTEQSQLTTGLPQVENFFQLALLINIVLAAFNMLPIKPLDGSKIVRWSVPVFVAVWAAVGALFWVFLRGF